MSNGAVSNGAVGASTFLPYTTRDRALAVSAGAARFGSRVLDVIVAIVLLLALFWAGFALWDTFVVYDGASADGLARYKPGTDGSANSALSFAELCAQNADVCAWLTIDDTSIDYPVVIGEDNYEYLNKSVMGEFALAGSLFLDYRNSRDFTDSYSVIYGHHLEGDAMFGPLPNFLETEFFDAHRTGSLFVRDVNDGEGEAATGAGTWHDVEFFACLYTDGYDSKVYSIEEGTDDARVEDLVAYLAENATQYRDGVAVAGSRVIALSTCSDATTNGRIILFGIVDW